jgi:heptosyltransferase-2
VASLVVQTSFLGDVVLSTPLIAELAKRGDVDVLTTLPGAQILANNPSIRQTLVYDKRNADRGLSGFTRVTRSLRRNYDIAYMAQGSLRSAGIAMAAGIPERIGFDTSAGRALYTRRVRYNPDRHHAERLWWLSMSDCADPPLPHQLQPHLYPEANERRAVDDLLGSNDVTGDFIVLAPGSAWGTKRWPFYPELATLITDQFRVVVVGGDADTAIGDTIVAQLEPGRGVNAAGRLSLLASAELIRRARAIVTNDSAPQHLASATGTPTVTLFGPTVAAFGFGPLAPGSQTAGLTDLACRPCHKHGPERCPLGHWRCMRELSSRQVYDGLMRTLSQERAPT